MRTLMTFLVGAAVGYVLGAQAGRERYDQLVRAGQIASTTAQKTYSGATATAEFTRSTAQRIRDARARKADRDEIDADGRQLEWEFASAVLAAEDAANSATNGHTRTASGSF
jgi:hypothetical protein